MCLTSAKLSSNGEQAKINLHMINVFVCNKWQQQQQLNQNLKAFTLNILVRKYKTWNC